MTANGQFPNHDRCHHYGASPMSKNSRNSQFFLKNLDHLINKYQICMSLASCMNPHDFC